MTEQIERIQEMEEKLDHCLAAAVKMQEALDVFEACTDDYVSLLDYYGGGQWMQDYEDDEAGKLPADLKRGVLAQDTVYDLIQDTKEIKMQMLKILAKIVE